MSEEQRVVGLHRMRVDRFLGLAAGVKTMLRSAQEIQDKKLADEAEKNAQDRD